LVNFSSPAIEEVGGEKEKKMELGRRAGGRGGDEASSTR
jgi:hypothetical protein